jgi:hypothetical protein
MKIQMRKVLATNIALMLALGVTAQAAEMTKFFARPGSKVRIEGTSSMHAWQVESSLIGGSLEAGENFPTQPGAQVKPGKVEAKAETFVTARSLKSLKPDGTPYSDAMDKIMHEKLKAEEQPKLVFKLTGLELKEAATANDAPYKFEAAGELLVGGQSKAITMPVQVLPLAEGRLKISGSVSVKMTDFKIEPPAPALAGGLITTGDEVKILFDWNVAQRAAK